ncbi:11620_t:CDS:2, partial [Dentiscutata erythropus]
MDFENSITNYFQSNDHIKWSAFGVLSHISNNIDFTSEHMNEIGDSLRKQLEILSKHKGLLQAARNKVTKLLENLQETLTSFGHQGSSTETPITSYDVQEENEHAVDENRMICVKNILEDSIYSNFSIILDLELQKKVLHEIFDEIDNYITDDIHGFLTTFFNKDLTARGWSNAINNMDSNENDSELLKNLKKLIQETLPKFLKALSLESLNPLRDITFLEKPHLNQFVHPLIDSALWIFANVNYIYGEIPLKDLGLKVRADGGARPGASQKKSVDDDIKNATSMAVLYNKIVIEEADARRQLFTDLRVYGLTAFKTELSLNMMDFRSVHRLFEVDHFCLPKDWVDMPNFVWLYEAVVKWALSINSTRNELIEHRKKRRVNRYSEIGIAKKLAPLRDQHQHQLSR